MATRMDRAVTTTDDVALPTYAGFLAGAWFVNFLDGSTNGRSKDDPSYVRVVRGGS